MNLISSRRKTQDMPGSFAVDFVVQSCHEDDHSLLPRTAYFIEAESIDIGNFRR